MSPFKFIFFSISIMLVGCSKKDAATMSSVDYHSTIDTIDNRDLIQFLTTLTGSQEKYINYDSTKDQFIIENDIIIGKEDAEKRLRSYSSAKEGQTANARTAQNRYSILVHESYIDNIKVYIDPNLPQDWRQASQNALNYYDTISGVKIFFLEVPNPNSANVKIVPYYDASDTIGLGRFPLYDGRPGDTVWINTKYNSVTMNYKIGTVVHELGHTLGYGHTNIKEGVLIEGTSSQDSQSVMNSVVNPWNGFTTGDVIAFKALYGFINRIGIIDVNNNALVKEGDINSEFKLMKPNVTDLRLSSDRISTIDAASTGFVKSPVLSSVWTVQKPNISELVLNGNCITSVDKSGNSFYKRGELNASWSSQRANARSIVSADSRVVVLDNSGNVFAREDLIYSPNWVQIASNVQSVTAFGNRIAIITNDGTCMIKEGPLSASFSTLKTNIKSVVLKGTRIAVIEKTTNNAYVKEGLTSATWILVRPNVLSLDITNERVAVVDNSNNAYVKMPALNSQWQFVGAGAKSIVISQ